MTPAASTDLEHHVFPIVRYAKTSSGGGPQAVAGTAFTFGEGTVITCWHCVQPPLGADEAYGVAVRRGGITSPYEFCSIDNLDRDENRADLAIGRIDWTPSGALTLADDSVRLGERVETYGYPFTTVVPDEAYTDFKALTFSPLFLRGYVTQHVRDASSGFPVIDLEMLSPLGLSGAPVIRDGGREVIGVVIGKQAVEMYGETQTFGRALGLDTLRAARSAATGGRALADYLAQ